MMDIVARELRTRCDMIVFSTSWYSLPLGDEVDGLFSPAEHRFGIHGGEIETSMMLALQPDRVDMARARNFRSSSQDRAERFPILGNGRSAKLGWQMQDYHPAGAAGNAAAATADRGRRVLDAAGRRGRAAAAVDAGRPARPRRLRFLARRPTPSSAPTDGALRAAA